MNAANHLKRFHYGLGTVLAGAVLAVVTVVPAPAADKLVKIGITGPFTGADAEVGGRLKNAATMAIEEANAAHTIPGYQIESVALDDASVTSGQSDPAQAATNARKLAADPAVVANVGPETSGEGKAMAAIFSTADLATITPTSTNPDITDPKFASQFRPKGKAIYFRTCATDAYQGPYMANFMKQTLKVKSIFVLDDSSAGAVGQANAFEEQAKKIGLDVLGHEQLNPKDIDYNTTLIKIKALKPDAIYYSGSGGAGTKLIAQAYSVIPKMVKAAGDGLYGGDSLKGAGFPSVEGWYVSVPAPHLVDNPKLEGWVNRFEERFHIPPDDSAIAAYDGTLVIIDAIKRVVAANQTLDRSNVRDALQKTKLETLQGEVAFDQNGDILNRVVSVFQVKHNTKFLDDDVIHQFTYLGEAPKS